MIPKKIFSFWINDEFDVPENMRLCLSSQVLKGYNHELLTIFDCKQINSEYLNQALAARKWVKAVDWLRMYVLYSFGGITLDLDVEILPNKNFDSLLHHRMFAAREENGFIGAAVIGAEKGYKFIKQWMEEVEANFRGDDDKNFESSMDILTRGYFEKDWEKDGFKILHTHTLYPYNHQTGITNITKETITMHHFLKSWVSEKELIP